MRLFLLRFWVISPKLLSYMKNEIDINKVLRQHLAVDAFLAGDFTIKGTDVVAEYTADGAGCENLEAIAGEVSVCRKCEISSARTNTVPGEGNPGARIVFVGEAPGADEDLTGRPFVGRAGKMLGNIISAMGLSRQDVFICNILKCRPLDNRDPKPDEIVNCLPYLKRQLDAIRPDVIIALGAHAAKTLLGTKKAIGQTRGQFHDFYFAEDEEPIKLMPTYHPSYLVRNYSPDNRRRVWEDMQKVLEELDLPVPQGKG